MTELVGHASYIARLQCTFDYFSCHVLEGDWCPVNFGIPSTETVARTIDFWEMYGQTHYPMQTLIDCANKKQCTLLYLQYFILTLWYTGHLTFELFIIHDQPSWPV